MSTSIVGQRVGSHLRAGAARRLRAAWPLALVILAGCRAGPLEERPGDLGPYADSDRLRAIDRLNLERFKVAGGAAGTEESSRREPALPMAPKDVTPDAAAAVTAKLRAQYQQAKKVELTLEAARVSALSSNLALRTALVDPLIAREALSAERAKFDAVFTPGVSVVSTDPPRLSGPQGTPNARSVQTQIGSGVSIPLRTGGRVSVDLTQTYSDNNSPFDTDGTTTSPAAGFSVTLPLLRGAGRLVNTASIVIAGYNAQIVEAATKLRVIATLAASDRAYWRLVAARQALDVTIAQYELASDLLAKAQRRQRAGSATGVDVLRAQSGVASRLDAIISAETNLLIVQRDFKRTVNMPGLALEDDVLVVPASQPAPVEYALAERSPELVNLARANRAELLQAELQILADALNIDVARNNTLPALDLSGGYTFNGIGTNQGEGLSTLFQNRFQGYSGSLRAEVPLSNEAANARLRSAILTRLQRLSDRATQQQAIEQETLDAIDRARSAWQRIMASQQSSVLAGRTLEAEQRQFDAGLRTATDVLDASTRLADAQLAEIRALADYQIALVDLAVATGTTLGQADVRWSPAEPVPVKSEKKP
ncbi:MAG: TolC family protein [Phycisphaerales bacterium]|nr:TolC family protein [Phycisphaerales bacterium]